MEDQNNFQSQNPKNFYLNAFTPLLQSRGRNRISRNGHGDKLTRSDSCPENHEEGGNLPPATATTRGGSQQGARDEEHHLNLQHHDEADDSIPLSTLYATKEQNRYAPLEEKVESEEQGSMERWEKRLCVGHPVSDGARRVERKGCRACPTCGRRED